MSFVLATIYLSTLARRLVTQTKLITYSIGFFTIFVSSSSRLTFKERVIVQPLPASSLGIFIPLLTGTSSTHVTTTTTLIQSDWYENAPISMIGFTKHLNYPRLQFAVISPCSEFAHAKDVSEVIITRLGAYPSFSTLLVAAAVKYDYRWALILHLYIQNQVRELFIYRTAALLPFGLNNQVIRPFFRMIHDEVTELFGSVNTFSNTTMPCVYWLPNDSGRDEAISWNKRVTGVSKAQDNKTFQDGTRLVSLRSTLNGMRHVG